MPVVVRPEVPTAVRGWRGLIYELRTEAEGRDAASVGVGVVIGCLPVFGFHLLLVLVVGRVLRLNRLRMYVAANISNPLMAPLLIFAEVQVGAWARREDLHALTLQTIRATSPWTFGADLLVGSLIVGIALGGALALVTHLVTTRFGDADPGFVAVARAAADRYLGASITAWEFARAKLLSDPVYEEVTIRGLLPPGRTLLDVGCGQGLMLALLSEIRRRNHERPPSDAHPPPVFEHLTGVEVRGRVARIARAVLREDATVLDIDVADAPLEPFGAVLAFDVLHMMSAVDQERLIVRLAAVLEPGGRMLVRDVDASQGWRFRLVHVGNWLKAVVTGHWRQRFCFRSVDDWTRLFASQGLHVQVVPMSRGTPFANVLFLLSRRGSAPAQRRA
jgi:SAM-dependent methyltransferase